MSFRTPAEKVSALPALLNEAIDQYLARQDHRDKMILEGLADVDAGRAVPHEKVAAWAKSLGSSKPSPRHRAKR